MSADHPRYEVVIGLEVHTQLRTQSKLFSPAPVSWGEPPNHSVHPVCLALPGVLPVLNKQAVELAIRAGLATHCEVRPHSVFARKNYFYPDLPKGYQISQYEEPVCERGWIDVPLEEKGEPSVKRIRLTRIHLEEDAGKSIHDPAVTGGEGPYRRTSPNRSRNHPEDARHDRRYPWRPCSRTRGRTRGLRRCTCPHGRIRQPTRLPIRSGHGQKA